MVVTALYPGPSLYGVVHAARGLTTLARTSPVTSLDDVDFTEKTFAVTTQSGTAYQCRALDPANFRPFVERIGLSLARPSHPESTE